MCLFHKLVFLLVHCNNALRLFHCCENFIYMILAFLQSEHFPFIHCVEDLSYQGKHAEWESCYEKLGLDSSLVDHCYHSEHGKEVSFFSFSFYFSDLVFVLERPCSRRDSSSVYNAIFFHSEMYLGVANYFE